MVGFLCKIVTSVHGYEQDKNRQCAYNATPWGVPVMFMPPRQS